MAIARSITSFMFFLLISSNSVNSSVLAQATTAKFTFIGFKGNQTEIQTEGASEIQHENGLLRLTNRNQNVTGTAFYRKPIRLRNFTNSSDIKVCSFSTSFVFVIIPSSPGTGGFGFTFTLSPTPNRPGAESAQYLGLLNRTNNGNASNHVFAVEFDTVQGFKDGADRRGNHIGLNFNNLSSDVQEPLIYYDTEDRKEDFQLESGEPIQVHVNYDGPSETLNVTIYPTRLEFKPKKPLISRRVSELSEILEDEMYVGFTAATGKDQSSAHYVMGWSFSSCGENPMADWLDPSKLPLPPRLSNKKGYDSQVIALIVALSIVTLVLLVLLFIFVMYKRRIQEEDTLEDWEIDYPHRFRYRDLYLATKKFKEKNFFLADWVMEFHTNGGILSAVDQKLGSSFNGREAKLALIVGLLCCHQKPTYRPSMRMVLRYLNGEDQNVPQIDGNWGFSDSSRDDLKTNVVGYVSSDRASSSNTFSSFSEVSSSSIVSGR
ncbi:unnamed protein product [Arabidopsis arenosa]|uniref:Legume lectin domain-containing protein n=1 Tax=Arabidopsis arenosa TaxID=38785 RepID=A0A8S1ZUS7_ARAAE|nr:unnamed protein product [Arabidopsis arenosa]